MSYVRMSPEEWQAFLRGPVRPATLATTREDGQPIWSPSGTTSTTTARCGFNTGSTSVKGRNLRRDARVALCVQDDQPPFSFVSVTGTAEVVDDLDEVRAWATRIGGRYMGADRAEEYGARNGVAGELVIRVHPEHVVAYRDVAN